MSRYVNYLPPTANRVLITDGGIETTLIFQEGMHLPEFASFVLLDTPVGYEVLYRYFRTYAQLAQCYQTGCVLESPTWRANPDWAAKLGYSRSAIADINHRAIRLLHEIRADYEWPNTLIIISGCIGPRDDGYSPKTQMQPREAEAYHMLQASVFKADIPQVDRS